MHTRAELNDQQRHPCNILNTYIITYQQYAAIVCTWVRFSCDLIFEFRTKGIVVHTVKYTILGGLFLFLKLTACTLVVVGCYIIVIIIIISINFLLQPTVSRTYIVIIRIVIRIILFTFLYHTQD